MKKHLFTILSIVVGVVLFLYLIYYIGLDNLAKLFGNMQWRYGIPYLIVSFLLFMGYVWRWKLIIDTHNFKTNFKDLFFYKTATFAVNFISPGARLAGEPIRTMLINQDGLEMPKAVSTVVMDKIIELAADVLMTTAGIVIFMLHFALKKETGLIVVADLLIFLLVIIWFFVRIHKGKGVFSTLIIKTRLARFRWFKERLRKTIESEKHMHSFMTDHGKTFWFTSFISIVLWLLSIFEFKFLSMMFGFNLSYTVLFAVLVGIGFAILIPVPAGLGALEFSQFIMMTITGENPSLGVVLGFITRLRDMMWTGVGMIYMSAKGIKIKDEIDKKSDDLV